MDLLPTVLEGEVVRLEALDHRHEEGLVAAAGEDRSTYAFTHVPDGRDEVAAYVAEAVAARAAGAAVPFAVVDRRSGRVVGSTRFLDLETFVWPPPGPAGAGRGLSLAEGAAPTVAEVGATWYAASVQGTVVNPEAKLLMLGHAFDGWQVLRITLKTDARNARSRAAIEKLGARFEGVRRAHVPATDGTVRDSAYYSILRDEWPEVRSGLERRLVAAAGTARS